MGNHKRKNLRILTNKKLVLLLLELLKWPVELLHSRQHQLLKVSRNIIHLKISIKKKMRLRMLRMKRLQPKRKKKLQQKRRLKPQLKRKLKRRKKKRKKRRPKPKRKKMPRMKRKIPRVKKRRRPKKRLKNQRLKRKRKRKKKPRRKRIKRMLRKWKKRKILKLVMLLIEINKLLIMLEKKLLRPLFPKKPVKKISLMMLHLNKRNTLMLLLPEELTQLVLMTIKEEELPHRLEIP